MLVRAVPCGWIFNHQSAFYIAFPRRARKVYAQIAYDHGVHGFNLAVHHSVDGSAGMGAWRGRQR